MVLKPLTLKLIMFYKNLPVTNFYKTTLILLFAVSLVNGNLFAQDVIFSTKGDSIKCKVQEVGEDSVTFSRWPVSRPIKNQFLSKKEINKIRYENGYLEIYSGESSASDLKKSISKIALPYDIIYTTNGDMLKVKVIDVDKTGVNYSNISSSTIDKIDIKKVIGIRYGNGYEEAYNAAPEVKQKLVESKIADVNAGNKVTVASSDIIKLKDGKEIRAKIIEVDDNSIAYKVSNSSDTSTLSLNFYDILKISYANGYEETYASYTRPNTPANDLSKNGKLTPEKTITPENKVADVPQNKSNEPMDDAAPIKGDFKAYQLSDLDKFTHYSSVKSAEADPDKVEFLDLQSQNLKLYPEEIKNLKNLIAINLSYNNLKDFPSEIFDFPKLQYVWLDNIGLKNLKFDKEEIEKIKKSNIVFMSLNNNKLTKIHSSIFDLNYLIELRLNNNQINSIAVDKGFDPKKSNLRIIDFQKNKFEAIPVELSDFPSIAGLNLAENNIKLIQNVPKGYKRLKAVKLNSNPLKTIDKSFYNISMLEELNLNQTFIATLPDSISKLSKLKILILPGTFSSFPNDFGQLKYLTELHINNNINSTQNRTLDISKSVFNCQKLRVLDISGANISPLSGDIGKLKRLESLYLVNCNLSSVPDALFSLPNLAVLDLDDNRITQLPANISESQASLATLNLQNSPLDVNSVLLLRRSLPSSEIRYFDVDMGLNFASRPFPSNMLGGVKKAFAACDQNDPVAYYKLGLFFATNRDYGLAIKAYRAVAENQNLSGTGQALVCQFAIADIYDDVDNVKSYQSPYKRKKYTDYDDYLNTANNNRAFQLYLKISDAQSKDDIAAQEVKKASARASIICNEIADNLVKIYDFNQSEIERLIQGSGNMQGVSAAGEKLVNDSQVQNSQAGAVIGGLMNLFGKVSSAVKDDKADRLKETNQRLKSDIEGLRNKAALLVAK